MTSSLGSLSPSGLICHWAHLPPGLGPCISPSLSPLVGLRSISHLPSTSLPSSHLNVPLSRPTHPLLHLNFPAEDMQITRSSSANLRMVRLVGTHQLMQRQQLLEGQQQPAATATVATALDVLDCLIDRGLGRVPALPRTPIAL